MLVDQYGKPIRKTYRAEYQRAVREVRRLQRRLAARYDAAETVTGNELHWQAADHLDPHSAASYQVRRTLRSRARYEVIENNPYLKGIILTIANDFVGTGPKLALTDERIPIEQRQRIERRFQEWAKRRRLRQKLWRSRIAKIVDGEAFWVAFTNDKKPYPVTLDFQVIEADQVSTHAAGTGAWVIGQDENNEIDGVRFDQYGQPTEYFVLNVHPGSSLLYSGRTGSVAGRWVSARWVVHWFRQDRGWLRGIPEITPSLPLCSVLRRYTLAVLRHAETAADITAVIETEGPPSPDVWADPDTGELVVDDPFGTFPIEVGSIMNLPWGYKLKQLDAVPLGVQYDEFVGALLREITRPILVPFNLAAGTSKDSNMASAIVDSEIYKGGQEAERIDCEETVLDHIFNLWWEEAARLPGYLDVNLPPELRSEPPERRWRWDAIGIEHTDPAKVAKAIDTLRKGRYMTDRDIQERFFNRSESQWREEIRRAEEFRAELDRIRPETKTKKANAKANGKSARFGLIPKN